MLTASSFAIHVTYTCPLTCAHCCFLSSPNAKDTLSPEFIRKSIDALPQNIKMVAFTGGEPFLHGNNLASYVRSAKQRGFSTRIVTSAYFGTTIDSAKKRLQEVKDAGLDELSISWDDFHAEFVKFDTVKNVVSAAIELGISTAINSVQILHSVWTRDVILSNLGELAAHVTLVTETHVNTTGRAEERLAESSMKSHGFLGPCPYVVTGPTLNAKGNLLACCGVIPENDRLIIAKNPDPRNIPALIESSYSNPLLLWLFLRGPYSLIEAIGSRLNISIPDKEKIGGNCEACKILFTENQLLSNIDFILGEKLVNIASELLLLKSLGFLEPQAILGLWSDRSLVRIGL